MKSFKQTIHPYLKRPMLVLFFVALLVSWVWQLSFRNNHFQEGDSSAAYSILYEFPTSALRMTALFYKPGNFLSEEKARAILAHPTVNKIRSSYLSNISDEFIVNQLTKSSLLATFRYGMIQAVAIAPLPFPIQGFFSMPLGSTYSAFPGFLYSLISGSQSAYTDFMSSSLLMTITLFHLTVLLFFLANRKLGINDFTNSSVSLCLLFSISAYSSGFHLGSTVWILCSEVTWLFFVIRYHEHKNFHSIISWVTGVLIFFNYLILFFWLSLILGQFINFIRANRINLTEVRKVFQWIWTKIKEQRAALLLIAICGILFYQPGEGFRGATSLSTFPSDFFYIILNYFSWYTHSIVWNVIQFILGLVLIGSGIFFLVSKKSSEMDSKNTLKRTLLGVFALYFILVIFGVLSFAPTRHMLFLLPAILFAAASGLDIIFKKFFASIPPALLITKIALLIVIGMFCISIRHADAYDRTRSLNVDEDVHSVGIYDSSHNIYYPLKEAGTDVNFINPKNFKPGEIYLYTSQTEPFEFAHSEWLREYNMNIQILSDKKIITETYFVAHNPHFSTSRYSRPNNFFQTKFKVTDIKKK